MADISSNGLIILYIITVLFIIVMYYSEINTPTKINYIELVGLFVIMILEFFIGFSITKNVGTLFLAVFVTWIVIFTPTLLIYLIPMNGYVDELNSIFSNVIGYLFVANEASNILSQLGLEKEGEDEGESIKESKRLIAQINNSKNIFINQLTPYNFDYLWNNLFSPLFKADKREEIKKRLLDITNQKFVIGKCIWYLYTCIISITISSFFMAL
jgi:hypothetical protein